MGENVAHHERLFKVERPAELSRILGEDASRLQHAVSNQSLTHALRQHGNEAIERARGQVAITRADFRVIPQVLRTGSYYPSDRRRGFVEIRAVIEGRTYVYQARVRRGPRRLDMVTMWKR